MACCTWLRMTSERLTLGIDAARHGASPVFAAAAGRRPRRTAAAAAYRSRPCPGPGAGRSTRRCTPPAAAGSPPAARCFHRPGQTRPPGRADLHDRCRPVGADERPPARLALCVQRAEQVADRAAHPGPERLRDTRREHHRGGRLQRRQRARKHGHPVLAEVLAVETAVHAVVDEGIVNLAVYHRQAVQADVRGVRDHTGRRRSA